VTGFLPAQLSWPSAVVIQDWRAHKNAAVDAGIEHLGTHSMRHSYRSWLDAVGTSVAVQQKLIRRADIRTTMIYGDVVSDVQK
jgi:site-specific recombinase XerD